MSHTTTQARVLAAVLSGVVLLGPTACSVVTTDVPTPGVASRELRRSIRSAEDENARDGKGGGRTVALDTRHERDHHDKRR